MEDSFDRFRYRKRTLRGLVAKSTGAKAQIVTRRIRANRAISTIGCGFWRNEVYRWVRFFKNKFVGTEGRPMLSHDRGDEVG